MKIIANQTSGFQFKRFALLGMSGLGKTFISRSLVKKDNWCHYSVDYEYGKRVRRQRTMLFRSKKDRSKLQSFLGKELGKDLNSVRNNAHLQICIDRNEISWGMRIDASAWYDLNVLIKRAEEENTREEIVKAAQQAASFDLVFNRNQGRPLSSTTTRDWRDIAGTICPGEHSMEVVRKMSASAVVENAAEIDDLISRDLLNLKEFFCLCNWTLDSPNGATA